MKNNSCILCQSKDLKIIHHGTRDNPNINVLKCSNCGHVMLDSFDHIHNNFYESSEMRKNIFNIEEWKKSTLIDNTRRLNNLKNLIKDKDVLDFGCGGGGFLECIKYVANTSCGVELDRTIQKNLREQGYIIYESIEEIEKKFDLITLFHVVEHLEYPIDILKKCKQRLKDNGIIAIETPNSDDILLSLYECSKFADFTYWSPHIQLYNFKNLIKIAELANLKYEYDIPLQRYNLANHLYWLSKGKSGGQNIFKIFNDEVINKEYLNLLYANHNNDTLFMCFSNKI